MTGYQEIISDPSYYGQIVIFTFPEIGITPPYVNFQSDSIYLAGVVTTTDSSTELDYILFEHNIVGIKNIDTRAISKNFENLVTY